MPTFCIGYSSNDELHDELQRKLKELYTAAPLPVHPELRECARCFTAQGYECQCPRVECGYEDTAVNYEKQSIETKIEQLAIQYDIALKYTAEQAVRMSQLAKQIAELDARISCVEDALATQTLQAQCGELIAEPLYPRFNLREELLKMQTWRLQNGTPPIDTATIRAAIKRVDEALTPIAVDTVGKRSDTGRY